MSLRSLLRSCLTKETIKPLLTAPVHYLVRVSLLKNSYYYYSYCKIIIYSNCFNNLYNSLESKAQESDMTESLPSTEENFVLGLPHKTDHGARPKIPSYPQNRRPAGGLSRPLPSPGKICIFLII